MKKRVKKPSVKPATKEVILPPKGVVRIVAPPGFVPVAAPLGTAARVLEIAPVKKKRRWWQF